MVKPYQEAPTEESIEQFAQSIKESVQSIFGTLPKETGYVEPDRFEQAYEVLVEQTDGFENWCFESVWNAYQQDRLVFVVVRTILALTPPEWQDIASEEQDMDISKNAARRIDAEIRCQEDKSRQQSTIKQIKALIRTAVEKIEEPTPETPDNVVHRFNLVDRKDGLDSIRNIYDVDIYPHLLRERYLGRPFASHKDSVSEERGDLMEDAIKDILDERGVPYDEDDDSNYDDDVQEADIYVPDWRNPDVVIEAKISNDDGTARDKIARVGNLAQRARQEGSDDDYAFQVVACVDGRGFGERNREPKNLIKYTQGKVFTFETLSDIIDFTAIHTHVGEQLDDDASQVDLPSYSDTDQ